ncbi:MAG: nitroreductase family protein [Actinomycetota bacterium]|nr:nitroreductase family protein [Actinomycetota bacterium]
MAMESMRMRRTIRKFTNERISESEIRDLLLAAMYAPSAWGKRSWEFIVVDDENFKKELGNLTPYSSQAAMAPIDIVVLSDKNASNAWIEDASVAAEHINLAAAKMGLGSSWIQVRGMNHNAMDAEVYLRELLGIPSNYGICCMIAVGHPAEQKSPHREGEFMPEKVHRNRFGMQAAA